MDDHDRRTTGMNGEQPVDPQRICFGFNRHDDEKSLAQFLRLFASSELLDVLIPRLEDQEITGLVDTLTGLMRNHLSEQEYHRLFLGDSSH